MLYVCMTSLFEEVECRPIRCVSHRRMNKRSGLRESFSNPIAWRLRSRPESMDCKTSIWGSSLFVIRNQNEAYGAVGLNKACELSIWKLETQLARMLKPKRKIQGTRNRPNSFQYVICWRCIFSTFIKEFSVWFFSSISLWVVWRVWIFQSIKKNRWLKISETKTMIVEDTLRKDQHWTDVGSAMP